ncbi:MAG TPA: AAA family ATPase [Candidatus Limnocylindrales bacterium]
MARRLSSPVFVGRSSELKTLVSAADAAASGETRFALVGGEAGVGKSRLVAELASRLRDRDWLVLEGGSVPVSADGLPFGPIVEALRALVRLVDRDRIAGAAGPSLPELARLLPELSSVVNEAPMPSNQAGWLQVRIFEGILKLFGGLAEVSPVLLIIEDVHWADRSTRDLLSFLVRNTRDERLLIVATFRSDELHRRHPMTVWLAEAQRQSRVERIDVTTFERNELVELLASITDGRPAAALVDSIARRSDGNAFFAEELIAAVDDASQSRQPLPETLRGVLLVRLSALSEDARRLVEIAAVAGREVEHEILAEVSGFTEATLGVALHAALDVQVLVIDRTGDLERYRFRHALVQEAAYDELLLSERRELHAAYARSIEGRSDGAGVARASRLVELAHHWAAAHEPARALAAAIAAGDASRDVYAYAEAARQYERAIEFWDVVAADDRPSGRDLGDLYEAASAAAFAVGDASRAVNLARRATELIDAGAGSGGDRERRASVRERFAPAFWLAGDTTTTLRLLREANAMLEGSPPSVVQARVLSSLAYYLPQTAGSEEALPFAERAIEAARAIGHLGIESRAMRTLGNALVQRGNFASGVDLLRRSLAIASHDDDPTMMHLGYNTLGAALDRYGLHEEAVNVCLAGAESIRRYGGELSFVTSLEDNAADSLINLGRYAEAAVLIDRHLGRELSGRVIHLHFTMAKLAVRTGDLPDALEHLEVARLGAGNDPDDHMLIDLHTFGSEIALWGGDPAAALAIARDGFARAGGPFSGGFLAFPAMHAAADLAERARAARDLTGVEVAITAAREVIDRYRALAGRMAEPDALTTREVEWRMALCEAEFARAMGEDDPARWDAVRQAVSARPEPFLEAYVLWRKAEALARRGDPVAATGSLRSGHEIAVAIGAKLLVAKIEGLGRRLRVKLTSSHAESATDAPVTPVPPVAPIVPANPFRLTEREREVLALVADGYTNRRIGEVLYISESTAGVHVSHILGKLDVGTRTEAAAVAVRLGLDRASLS